MRAAFDQIADQYDHEFTDSLIGRHQRNLVWHYLIHHPAFTGANILEVNCGTGEDAIFLASRRNQVLATDISPRMVSVASLKIRQNRLEDTVRSQVCDLSDLSRVNQEFDIIFSNFGGFNCLSPERLKQAVEGMAQRLQPNGRVVAVLMSGFCLWETLYFLSRGNPKQAFRRWSSQPTKATIGQGATQPTWYYPPGSLKHLMGARFRLVALRPVGFFIPPSYLEGYFAQRPKLLKKLESLDKRLAGLNFLSLASDHYLAEFKRKE